MMRCSWDVSSECVAQENSDSVVPQSKELLNEEAVSLEVSEVSKYVMGCNGNSEFVYVVLLESSRDSPDCRKVSTVEEVIDNRYGERAVRECSCLRCRLRSRSVFPDLSNFLLLFRRELRNLIGGIDGELLPACGINDRSWSGVEDSGCVLVSIVRNTCKSP